MCMAPAGEVVCGNAMLEVGEECDDGNLQSGDGCSVHASSSVAGGVRAPPSGGVGSLRSTCSRHCGDGVVQWTSAKSATAQPRRAATRRRVA